MENMGTFLLFAFVFSTLKQTLLANNNCKYTNHVTVDLKVNWSRDSLYMKMYGTPKSRYSFYDKQLMSCLCTNMFEVFL